MQTTSVAKRLASVQAMHASLAERRVALADKLLHVADRLIDELHEPATVFHWDKDGGWHERELPEPPSREKQALMTTAAIAVDKAQLLTGEATARVAAVAGLSMEERMHRIEALRLRLESRNVDTIEAGAVEGFVRRDCSIDD